MDISRYPGFNSSIHAMSLVLSVKLSVLIINRFILKRNLIKNILKPIMIVNSRKFTTLRSVRYSLILQKIKFFRVKEHQYLKYTSHKVTGYLLLTFGYRNNCVIFKFNV